MGCVINKLGRNSIYILKQSAATKILPHVVKTLRALKHDMQLKPEQG